MPRNPLLHRPYAVPEAAVNRYERFGWDRNPFPDRLGVVPGGEDPRSNGSIYVESVRSREQRRFEELLIPTLDRPARSMAFLREMAGRVRGIGKTAFLNRQRQRVMTDLGRTLSGRQDYLFAAHLFPPGGTNSRKFWQFARLVIGVLNEQEVMAELLWLLRAFSGCIPDPILDQANDLPTTLGNDDWLRQQGVAVDRDLVPTVSRKLVEAGVGEELAEALAKHGHAADRFRLEFLRTISDYRWRQIAGPWLTDDFVAAFRSAGFHRGLVFVDDFEKIVLGQNTAERRTFADDIRYSFVEGPTLAARTKFYSLLWVIHPLVEEILIRHWNAAGLDRFCALTGDMAPACRIEFHPLSAADAELLVAEYIGAARRTHVNDDALWPFSPAAIAATFQIARQLPGHLLSWLNLAVEKAADDGWPDLSEERLVEFARTHPPRLLEERAEAQPLPAPEADLRAGEG